MFEDYYVELLSPNEDGTPTAEELEAQRVADEKARADAEALKLAEAEKNKTKTFTQDELNEHITNRLGKEKVRILKRLGIEDEQQIDEIIKKSNEFDTLKAENEQFKAEKENAKYEKALTSVDADPTFVEFLMGKIDKGENIEQFTENAKAYLEANPKFKTENFSNMDSSLNVKNGSTYPDFTKMTTAQYLAWRAKNPL